MPIAYVDDVHSADPNIGLSTTMTVPTGVSNGDFMIASVICQEANDGTSALIKSATLTAWTDLFTDGYSESLTTKQYVIDPPSENRYFWWMGWRIASSEPASYTVEVKTGGGSGYNRLDADIVAYSTATSIAEFAATSYTGATVTALTCPAVTIAPGTKVFLPSVGFQVFGGVTVVFGAGEERFLLVGGWANNGQGFTPPAGFIERVDYDSADAPRINVTWADLGPIQVGFVPQIYRLVQV